MAGSNNQSKVYYLSFNEFDKELENMEEVVSILCWICYFHNTNLYNYDLSKKLLSWMAGGGAEVGAGGEKEGMEGRKEEEGECWTSQFSNVSY